MKTLSKSEIIQRFSIGKDIYTNSKLDSSGFVVNNDKYNTNGVIFSGHWAYYTNNQFILRCPAHDRPYYEGDLEFEYNNEEDPIKELDILDIQAKKQGRGQTLLFYNYEDNTSSDTGESELTNYWIKNFEQSFLGFKTNRVTFRKNDLLEKIDSIFGKKVNDKAASALVMTADYEASVLRCKVIRFKKRDVSKEVEFTIPIYVDAFFNLTSECDYQPMMAVNILYLGLIQAFQENEYVNMSFNYIPADVKTRTAFLKDNGFKTIFRVGFSGFGVENQPNIELGLTQICPPFNPFE